MVPRLRISVFLREAQINHVNHLRSLPNPDQKVVWLNVSMDKVLRVEKLDPIQDLLSDHQHSL
jgi:hypothetical protein